MSESLAHDDELLRRYLAAHDAAEAESLLSELVSDRAAPVIKSVVAHRLHSEAHGDARSQGDAEDVGGEATLRIVSRLREMRLDPAAAARIENFRGYVAVTAYHCCHDYLRRKRPRRHDLKNKLRYLLTHDARFALWDGRGGAAVCGLAGQRPQGGGEGLSPASALASKLGDDFAASRLGGRDPRRVSLPELVSALFDVARAPVELDALVNAVAALTGLEEQGELSGRVTSPAGDAGDVRDTRASVVEESERRAYLARLWAEIGALPPRQRAALLLNLKDAAGNSQLELFVLTGVTTMREIGATLEVSPEEFARLWQELPLDDNAVGARLGLARQQIINLRKSARERLARRMSASGL